MNIYLQLCKNIILTHFFCFKLQPSLAGVFINLSNKQNALKQFKSSIWSINSRKSVIKCMVVNQERTIICYDSCLFCIMPIYHDFCVFMLAFVLRSYQMTSSNTGATFLKDEITFGISVSQMTTDMFHLS